MSNNKEIIAVKNQHKNLIEEFLQTQKSVLPEVNIYETDTEFVLKANMPGVSRSDVAVKVENDTLILFGKITDYADAVKRKYILNESEIGNYYRDFKISENIDVNKIEARLDNGQLIVNLPKIEKAKTRTIEIS